LPSVLAHRSVNIDFKQTVAPLILESTRFLSLQLNWIGLIQPPMHWIHFLMFMDLPQIYIKPPLPQINRLVSQSFYFSMFGLLITNYLIMVSYASFAYVGISTMFIITFHKGQKVPGAWIRVITANLYCSNSHLHS